MHRRVTVAGKIAADHHQLLLTIVPGSSPCPSRGSLPVRDDGPVSLGVLGFPPLCRGHSPMCCSEAGTGIGNPQDPGPATSQHPHFLLALQTVGC